MALLPAERYDDIRHAVDPMIDEAALPTEVIAGPSYLGQAERWVLKNDPLAATRTGDELESLYMAIIFRTAGLLSPIVPQAKQVNMAGHNVTLNYGETAQERTNRLLQAATDALTDYLSIPEFEVASAMTFVTTVSGRRG